MKRKILLAGRLDLGPLARHIRAFIETLSSDPDNEIYLDEYYIEHYRVEQFGTTQLLKEYLSRKNVHRADPELTYDFSVFTDLLTLEYGDGVYEYFLRYRSKVKICYEVFDGSLPPLDWIDIINGNFDMCCSPSVYVADRLRKNGVTVPCFHLPCVVFNDEIARKYPRPDGKTWRFGFIGGAEQRKNLKKVIEAFHLAFKNQKDVELYVHSSYSPEREYVQACFDLIEAYKDESKITFNFERPISKEEMYELISTFSFYVYPTKNTGYFTTPCEALSAGVPIMVSDIPVHQELMAGLSERDGVFAIRADRADLMIHSYLGNKCLGAQYDTTVEEISRQMRNAYALRDELFSEEGVEKRKARGKAYGLAALTDVYLSLFHPRGCVLAEECGVKDGKLYVNNEAVYEKYRTLDPGLTLDRSGKDVIEPFRYDIHDERATELFEYASKRVEEVRSREYVTRLKRHYLETGMDFDAVTHSSLFIDSKWFKKTVSKAEKYHVRRLPRFVYAVFYLYCKFRQAASLFGRKG